MHRVKLVDFRCFGNVVRLYYTDDLELERWWGDDWDDRPYEHNAGEVYPEYFDGYLELAFPSAYVVGEPCLGHLNSPYSKSDMMARCVPMISACRFLDDGSYERSAAECDFSRIVARDDAIRLYMGDIVDVDGLAEWLPSDVHMFPLVARHTLSGVR
jgi:hypothetical protein